MQLIPYTETTQNSFIPVIQHRRKRPLKSVSSTSDNRVVLHTTSDLLEEHNIHISEVLDLVRRGYSSWSTTKENPQVVTEVLSDLQRDYEKLLSRAKALVSWCRGVTLEARR